MSMIVEKVELDRVKAKLNSLKNKKSAEATSLLGKRNRSPTPESDKIIIANRNSAQDP